MNENMQSCELGIPYPPAQTEGKNLFYASLLTNDYAGIISEMSAVTSYMYQHLISSNQKIADTIKCISLVEMRHLGFIGELISSFGGNPRLAVQSGCNSSFWSAHNISYETNPKCFLKENIASERSAVANYNVRMNQIHDVNVQSLLARIVLDEEHHIKLFMALLEEIN